MWYHGSNPRYGWYIRGVFPDGRFYGVITMFLGKGGKKVNATGTLSGQDYACFVSLVKEIEKEGFADDSHLPWDGLLAEGPPSNPRIILRYRRSEGRDSPGNSPFLRVIEVLDPYLHGFYEAMS